MGYGFRVEQVPFLRAMGQPESTSPRVMVSRDEGEESEVGGIHHVLKKLDYSLRSCVEGYQ